MSHVFPNFKRHFFLIQFLPHYFDVLNYHNTFDSCQIVTIVVTVKVNKFLAAVKFYRRFYIKISVNVHLTAVKLYL